MLLVEKLGELTPKKKIAEHPPIQIPIVAEHPLTLSTYPFPNQYDLSTSLHVLDVAVCWVRNYFQLQGFIAK